MEAQRCQCIRPTAKWIVSAPELTVEDFRNYLVLTINDEVQVDVSRQAWKVTHAEALPGVETRTSEGVRIPYLGMQSLIESK
ncbi:MAG: hypothetical protein ACXW3Z_03885 [Limisphaerales bacterium]